MSRGFADPDISVPEDRLAPACRISNPNSLPKGAADAPLSRESRLRSLHTPDSGVKKIYWRRLVAVMVDRPFFCHGPQTSWESEHFASWQLTGSPVHLFYFEDVPNSLEK